MTISPGTPLPATTLMRIGENGPEPVALAPLLEGKKTVIFGLPGAFTPTCSSAHLPSFMRNREAFTAKGVSEIICISVNDPFVMAAWDEATGAAKAGVTLLADPQSAFTSATGLAFDAPEIGFNARSLRYAMLVDNGVVSALQVEDDAGQCSVSGGEALLEAI